MVTISNEVTSCKEGKLRIDVAAFVDQKVNETDLITGTVERTA